MMVSPHDQCTQVANQLLVRSRAGRGVPVVIHKEHHIYVPELIFGHLLTSSNYDDDERKGGYSVQF